MEPSIFYMLFYTASLITLVVVPLVDEKQHGLKEYISLSSRYSFLNNFFLYVISVMIGTLTFGITYGTMFSFNWFEHISGNVLFWLFFLYTTSMVAYAFLVSSLVSSSMLIIFFSLFIFKSYYFVCSISGTTHWHFGIFSAVSIASQHHFGEI